MNPLFGSSQGLSSGIGAMSSGDIDGDGDVDVAVTLSLRTPPVTQLLLNDGRGRFTAVVNGTAGNLPEGSLAMVDVNNDGSLDVPGVGYLNALAPASAAARALYVRAVGRRGGRSEHGGSVCLRKANASFNGSFVACRLIGGGDGGLNGASSMYDVHFVVPDAAASYHLQMWFPSSGRRHSGATQLKMQLPSGTEQYSSCAEVASASSHHMHRMCCAQSYHTTAHVS